MTSLSLAIAKIPYGPYIEFNDEKVLDRWKLKYRSKLTPSVSRCTFVNPDIKINPFENQIENFGRHFLVKSYTKGVARYYTTCNVLSKQLWPFYQQSLMRDKMIFKGKL